MPETFGESILVRDPSGTYQFFVKYRCHITRNSMVFAVSKVSNSVSPDMKRTQRGKFKAMIKPKKNVTKASNMRKQSP